MLTIGSIVLTVEDITRAGDFWRAALGYVNRREPSDDWVILDPPVQEDTGMPPGASLALSVTGYPQHYPPRIHLDLYAEDQAAEIERLLGLGAREVDWDDYPDDADWVVLEDTEGNRFCVVQTGPDERRRTDAASVQRGDRRADRLAVGLAARQRREVVDEHEPRRARVRPDLVRRPPRAPLRAARTRCAAAPRRAGRRRRMPRPSARRGRRRRPPTRDPGSPRTTRSTRSSEMFTPPETMTLSMRPRTRSTSSSMIPASPVRYHRVPSASRRNTASVASASPR